MTNRFEVRKHNILAQLGAPEGEYHDLSPKGSVDEPIRDLIGQINAIDGLVTTSSCSGRISVFLEGRKTGGDVEVTESDTESRAGPGGKGGGGTWLFISHNPVQTPDTSPATIYMSLFGLDGTTTVDHLSPDAHSRYIHLKFEPMILHILSASISHSQRLLTAALSAGFRESGAVGLSTTKTGDSTPMVAVRSTGYSFDSIIGYQDDAGRNISLVDETYLQTLVAIANSRFQINVERIERFYQALDETFRTSSARAGASYKPVWEDAEARRRRKREEGLARQQALQVAKTGANETAESDLTQRESI